MEHRGAGPRHRDDPVGQPGRPVRGGHAHRLAADVTPTSGADNPTGGANLNGVSLPVGDNSLTAKYTPGAGFTGSTSAPVVVKVTAVAPRSTTSVLTVDPVTGAAYSAVTFTCAVSANTGAVNGTARFLDNGVQFASAPIVSGASAAVVNSSRAPGAHSFVCDFLGSAPYTNSVSPAVTASPRRALTRTSRLSSSTSRLVRSPSPRPTAR